LLFDAHHLGRRETGNETWTRNVVRSITTLAAPEEIEYAVTSAGCAEVGRLTTEPVHVVSGHSSRRLLLDLPSIIRRIDAAAVFVTYTMPPTRRPVVAMVHDISPWYAEAAFWLPLRTRVGHRTSVGMTCRRAAHLLVLTDTTKRELVATLGIAPERISVVGAALDVDFEEELVARPREARPDGSAFRVLAVGNVVPRKNLGVVAAAVRAAREAGVDMHLRIVGTVEPGNPLAKDIERQLGPSVSFTGYVSLPALVAEYTAADAMCFPSMVEGFGLPVLEAMAAGVPVVVSDRGALPEVAGDAAIVCPAGNPSSWLSALIRLAADPALREDMRGRGSGRVDRFSWDRTAQAVLDALRAASLSQGSAV